MHDANEHGVVCNIMDWQVLRAEDSTLMTAVPEPQAVHGKSVVGRAAAAIKAKLRTGGQ
jgi:hypothetical protein